MRVIVGCVVCLLMAGFASPQAASAGDAAETSVVEAEAPAPNRADEPLADEYSLERATEFLDAASLTWHNERRCFTCHTNYAYLYARPLISADHAAHHTIREAAENLVRTRWIAKGPRWNAEIVATAAALAFNDSVTTGRLHPVTRTALDRMWTVQRDDGGFDWLKCDWPPMESDDHYGVTLAAIAAGAAPDHYRTSRAAQKGLAGIRRYFAANPPPTLHHQAMLVWANSYLPGLLTPNEHDATIEQLRTLQKPDGGWSLATLGNWQREDGSPQDTDHSDGYGTGFVVFVLLRSGESPASSAVQNGIAWLQSHQRASGRWFTRSLHRDNHHFISHAGSAMAIMALRTAETTAPGQPATVSRAP